jgi:hypothetical protein
MMGTVDFTGVRREEMSGLEELDWIREVAVQGLAGMPPQEVR